MSEVTNIAAAFARAIHAGDADAAHAMLSDDCGRTMSASELADEYNVLAEDMGGVTGIGDATVILEDWPGKADGDCAMVYVPLEGDVFSEAVTVTVAVSGDGFCISGVEWGRP